MTATDPAPFDDVPENRRWIDAELSAQLAELADRGESDTAEFKRGLPEQASSLAKEIAGFATSRAGRIFLGVEDDGAIVGIEDCDTHDGRNRIRSRIEGIVKTVQPLVHVRLSFAAAGERVDCC
ncbi:helix-turn-helix domain-containing protein [Sphingobium sp.]|uniref:AlbA family DNA-binding domain-containing protein n=1 Tax=Sphingobium sp. TaxID=1912891 RepID=UPI003B3B3582